MTDAAHTSAWLWSPCVSGLSPTARLPPPLPSRLRQHPEEQQALAQTCTSQCPSLGIFTRPQENGQMPVAWLHLAVLTAICATLFGTYMSRAQMQEVQTQDTGCSSHTCRSQQPNVNPGHVALDSCQDSLRKLWVALAVGGHQVVPDPCQVRHAGLTHDVLHDQHESRQTACISPLSRAAP